MKSLVLPRILSAGLAFAAVAGLVLVVASSGSLTWAVQVATPGTAGGFALGVTADVLSLVLLLFIASIAWLVSSYSARNLAGQLGIGRFAGWLTLATVGLAVMVLGASLPVIALGWSISGFAVSHLVGHAQVESARQASRYVRRWLRMSDAALWVGVLAGLALLPSVDRAADFTSGAATVVVAAVLLIAATIRSALFPVSRWLPETAEAPSPLSGFLHAGVVNGAGLLVLLMWPLFAAAPPVLAALLIIGVASVAVGTWRGRVRADVKGQLASSTTSQMGYMAIQLGIGLPAAALLHLMGHGYYKAWLFLRAGGAVTRARWRGVSEAPRFGPRTVAFVLGFVGLAALLAAPAIAGSVGKLGIAALLPVILAFVAVAVAAAASTAAAAGAAGVTGAAGRGLVVGGAAAALAAAYLWFLWGWEELFAAQLPTMPVWSPVVAASWLALLVASGVGVALVAARLNRGQQRRLWARLARTTLPPTIQAKLRQSARSLTATSRAGVAPADAPSAEQVLAAQALVEVTGSVVGPVWPLRDFVAVNHVAGTTGLEFSDIDAIVRDVYGCSVYQSPSDYLRLFDEGAIRATSVEAVLASPTGVALGGAVPPRLTTFGALLDATRAMAGRDEAAKAHQVAGRHGAAEQGERGAGESGGLRFGTLPAAHTEVPAALTGLWCRVAWSQAHSGTGPWTELRRGVDDETADSAMDALLGCRGASAWLRTLPQDPFAALAVLMAAPEVDSAGWESGTNLDVGIQAVQALPGWSGHAQWRVRRGDPSALASVIATHRALHLLHVDDPARVLIAPSPEAAAVADQYSDWPARAEVWQRALEYGYRDRLVSEIRDARPPVVSQDVVRASLVFCIDVRSERMRRALERTGPYRTYGYAGFFGAALRYQTETGADFDQCPALISSNRSVSAVAGGDNAGASVRDLVTTAERAVAGAPVLPVLVAEFGGLFAGVANTMQNVASSRWRQLGHEWGTVSDRWGPRDLALDEPAKRLSEGSASEGRAAVTSPGQQAHQQPSYRLTDLVGMARDFLRLTGVGQPYGELLVIVGHGATVENNAFAAGYDCGACGGNSGHINARVLASALNHTQVRAALTAEGWHLPASCSAVAAVHDTTTDTIEFDPYTSVDPGALTAMSDDVERARTSVLAERLALLPGAGRSDRSARSPRAQVARRGTDWAQPVPEWGLAGNAAFVVGPRHLTAHLDLAGRVFLHSYDAAVDDSEASGLRTILTAPVVVAHWINSQYYLSTVAPGAFGAGDKTTHNVIGDVGVTTGAHGDLRVGLPWQSVRPTDPATPVGPLTQPATGAPAHLGGHQPLRLLVVVAAGQAEVADIVASDATLTDLLASGWITLVVCPPESDEALELRSDLRWVPWRRIEPATSARLGDLAHRFG